MSVKIKINIPLDIIEEKVHNDKVGLLMATTCAKAMFDFVPAKTETLANTTTIEPWKVTYEQEYAWYMYHGSHLNFRKEKHPNATAYWDRATQTAKGAQIAQEMTRYIKNG